MKKPMPLLIASDHGGFALKQKLKSYLESRGFLVKDLGAYSAQRCDYPVFAIAVARKISSGQYRRGIIICKSGIGNSIVANRVAGVRAALCYNETAARLSREHNDSNVLVLGSLFINAAKAKRIAGVWLKTGFSGGRHRRRLNQIRKIEREMGYRK